MRSQRQYIMDIIRAMEAAERFVADVPFEDLEDDLEKQYALQRAFEIVGEATKQLDPALRERYPEVPWSDMAGMRDIIVHGYFAVDLDVVWRAIHEDFPRDKKNLRHILDELPPDA
jgi:uncharacterized protein with HEPN domain